MSKSNNNISSSLVHQQNNEGGYDAILAKFNTTGTLIWGTYFGGNADDIPVLVKSLTTQL